MKKVPITDLLIERGFFPDRKTAESWIMSGKVIVNNERVETSGQRFAVNSEIRIKGLDLKYVGKGGLKLEGALADFQLHVEGIVALDAGACTGGFTDCLLQHGASKVYAVDVGYGQLAGKLRVDKRVVNMERTNIGDVLPERLNPKPTLATVDLSYLSLKKSIPIISKLLSHDGEMICLVKPLFEVEDSEIRRTGVIDSPSVYFEVLHDLAQYVSSIGYSVRGITHSHVTGNNGTREFFLWIH